MNISLDKLIVIGKGVILVSFVAIGFFECKNFNAKSESTYKTAVEQPVPEVEQIDPLLTKYQVSYFIGKSEVKLFDISFLPFEHQIQLLSAIEERLLDLSMDIQYSNSEVITYTFVTARGLGVMKLPKSWDNLLRWNYLNELLISMTDENIDAVFQEPSMSHIPFTVNGAFLKAQEHYVDPISFLEEEHKELLVYSIDFLSTRNVKVLLVKTDKVNVYKEGKSTIIELSQNLSLSELWDNINYLLIAVHNGQF